MEVYLSGFQRQVAEEILQKCLAAQDILRKAKQSGHVLLGDEYPSLINCAGRYAHALHCDLKREGQNIEHAQQMIVQRRVAPDDPEFYMQLHPIEDLLEILGYSVKSYCEARR